MLYMNLSISNTITRFKDKPVKNRMVSFTTTSGFWCDISALLVLVIEVEVGVIVLV